MSLEAITYVRKHSNAAKGNLIVFLALADYAHDDRISYLADATLAKSARLSDRKAQRSLRNLEKMGEIFLVKKGGKKLPSSYASNVVFLSIRKIKKSQVSADRSNPSSERSQRNGYMSW